MNIIFVSNKMAQAKTLSVFHLALIALALVAIPVLITLMFIVPVSYTHLDVYKRQWLSRADAEVPIYALSPDKFARRKLTLHRGVYPFPIEQGSKKRDEVLNEMEQVLLKERAVSTGDLVLFTFGEPIGAPGGTNTLKIVKIGEQKN